MKEYTTQQLRNIALIGHGSSGKTTLVEALLFLGGALNRRGKVEEGNTVTDFDDEEIRRHISLSLALAPVEWQGYKINLLDTPGYTDFAGEVKSALRAADAALLVLDAAAGVEVGSELTWGYAEEESLPRLVLINKMDRENANFEQTLKGLETTFPGVDFLPLMLPIGAQASFSGVVDVLGQKAYMGEKATAAAIPGDLAGQAEEIYTRIVEAAAEGDDELMMKYFDEGALTPEEIARGLRQVVQKGTFVPVMVASGGNLVGARTLLDILVQVAPSPDIHPFQAEGPQGEEDLAVSDIGPLALLVFKTTADPFVGKLTYFRVCSGIAESGSTVYNSRAQQEERLGQLYVVRGKEQTNSDRFHAGDLGVVAKMSVALTGDTLSTKDRKYTIRGPIFPDPLYSVAVYPKTKGDTAKMGSTLTRMCEEDPTLHWNPEHVTRETLLWGMGDAHIDTAIRRMEKRFGVHLEVRTPKVPYKETVTATTSAQYRHKKQSGGAGQFAEVHLRLEPLPRDTGFEYVWEVFGGRISSSFMPSIEKGVKSVLEQGVLAGYPIVDVKVAVYDGKEHPVDSKDIAFQIAGREGFKTAFRDAKPVLLEPMHIFTISVPEEFTGDVMSDLNTRRARVQGMDQQGNKSIVTALAPLAEMQQYATNLRAITQGRGIYRMEYSHYDPVPAHMAQQIIAQMKVEQETE